MNVRARDGSRPGMPASSRSRAREPGKVRVALHGSLAGFALLLLELTLVLLLHGGEVSSIWEVQNGASLLLPGYAVLAIVLGSCGGLLLQLLGQAERSRPHRIML